jgi:CHAD domain-containing protein
MPLAVDRVRRQPDKLRKSLRKSRKDVGVENVHQLRTRSRRLEPILRALRLDSRQNGGQLLQAIKPVRSTAGKVRDLDVLAGFAARLRVQGEEECSIRLLEHLGSERDVKARKLLKVAAKYTSEITKDLKQFRRYIQIADRASFANWAEEAIAVALHLENELRDWSKLNRKNLHPFRLKVKELRYILQMAEQPDGEFVDRLGEVKDSIGEWHDWQELAEIAAEVIQHPGCKLIKEVRSTTQKKSQEALALANRTREEYLSVSATKQRERNSKTPSARAARPATEAAILLAA